MQPYQYTLVATDSNRLESIPSTPVTATKTYWESAKFERFSYLIDKEEKQILLSWEISFETPTVAIMVYRAKGEEQLSMLTKIGGTISKYTDANISINTSYKYRIKAIFEDGRFSEWSEEIKVVY